ncbi:MAG TPA: biopolymer transporter ExbD [Acidobacteriota bacterium]|jgi:biopolymer transport protein ExbD/biopolymer transport protein TolR
MSSGAGSRISGVTSEINVTPMADIMLVLLIIFMITTPLLQEGVIINMAKAQNPQVAVGAKDEDATTISLTRDQKVYLNAEEVAEDKLQEKLTDAQAKASDKPLFVRSDIAVKYGKVVEVVNKARDAGWTRIGLLVDREEKATKPGQP